MKKNKILGILLIIIGILIPIVKYLLNIYFNTLKEKKVIYYMETTSLNNEPNETDYLLNDEIKNNYIAILEIPSISLKKGLVAKDNKYNDIEYNIAILESSNMPDIKNSNLILASHNGNSDVSFFRNLEKLSIDEQVYIYYNGYKYIYSITNYYVVSKTGKINITRDKTKNTITLITCKNNSDTEQIVYIGYLISKETY